MASVGEEMVIMPLGGGQEVGRSCILLQYQSRNILLDCGCHPGREGLESLPFFDSLDNPEDIDLILITHFHIDHCAALPYFTERTNFKGKILMTHATKAVMKLLLSDNIRLHSKHPPLYNEQDLQNCIDKIDVINYHQTVEYKGIKVTATAAGHVLGAAMFSIDIDNIKALYTGDYSLEEDRHLIPAELPPGGPPDVLIVESTFGTTNLQPREKREAEFLRAVESIVSRGGSCLIPVFALGRAQELLLILDEHWKANPDLHHIPIFYASKLANKSLRVYQTFANMMNQHVRALADVFQNPFQLQHIRSFQQNEWEGLGPSVVLASPGFLQSGISRALFENWCDDERHGVILAGYTVEGTLANDLLSMPSEIKCLDNRIKPRRCQIEHITFAAHVDYQQNRSFIRSVLPDYIVLVHGERTQMRRLKDALEQEMKKSWPSHHKPAIATPENGVRVKLRFRKNIVADVLGGAALEVLQGLEATTATKSEDEVKADGEAAEREATSPESRPRSGSSVGAAVATAAAGGSGVSHPGAASRSVELPPQTLLVTENFVSRVVAARDLPNVTSCRVSTIRERLVLPVPADVSLLLLQCAAAKEGSTASARGERAGKGKAAQKQTGHSLDADEEDRALALQLVIRQLEKVYDELTVPSSSGSSGQTGEYAVCVQGLVTVGLEFLNGGRLSSLALTWNASPGADMVADSVVGLLTQLLSAPQLVKRAIMLQSQARMGDAAPSHKRRAGTTA